MSFTIKVILGLALVAFVAFLIFELSMLDPKGSARELALGDFVDSDFDVDEGLALDDAAQRARTAYFGETRHGAVPWKSITPEAQEAWRNVARAVLEE